MICGVAAITRATMTDPKVLIADDWNDYALLDSGDGRKLERVGKFTFVRPEPQALWQPRLALPNWTGADAIFAPGDKADDEDTGRWRFERQLPTSWPLAWRGLRFLGRPTPFRHLAFFPEHSVHWAYAQDCIAAHSGQDPPEVLNLFGYSGLASLACAAAGAKVTHLDASKKAIGMARDNQAEAGLTQAPIRWIADDALTFVHRELRRGRRYDGVILDPPKYGRGPNGEVWRLESQLHELIDACARLLRQNPQDNASAKGFLIATVYAVRLSYVALAQVTKDAIAPSKGTLEAGEMTLPHATDDRLLPTAIFARWRG
jgi:23S rRNA (cytosine1962-C5)-methyltransferase